MPTSDAWTQQRDELEALRDNPFGLLDDTFHEHAQKANLELMAKQTADFRKRWVHDTICFVVMMKEICDDVTREESSCLGPGDGCLTDLQKAFADAIGLLANISEVEGAKEKDARYKTSEHDEKINTMIGCIEAAITNGTKGVEECIDNHYKKRPKAD